MQILVRLLFVLLTLRLLAPPGVCLCKLSAPAARLLADALNNQHPVPDESDDHDDHHEGCPCNPNNQGMGLRPAGPGPIELPLVALLPVLSETAAPGPALPIELSFAELPRPPLCLTCCALRC